MRTTSSVEAMNSVIQRSLPRNTNIYKFTSNLQLHEAVKSSSLYQISLGEITNKNFERKRREDKLREEKISFFTKLLKDGKISVDEFLECMSGKDILPPVGG